MELDETDFLGSAATSEHEGPSDQGGDRQDLASVLDARGVYRSDSMMQGGGKDRDGGLILPLSRVKRMIKHVNDTRAVPEDQQVKAVSADAAFLIGRAAELLLDDLIEKAAKQLGSGGPVPSIEYDHIAGVVQPDPALRFLKDIVPPRYSINDLLHLLQKREEYERETNEGSEADDDDLDNGGDNRITSPWHAANGAHLQ